MWSITKKAWERLREAIEQHFGLNEDEINHYLEQYGFQEETESLGRWKVTGDKSE